MRCSASWKSVKSFARLPKSEKQHTVHLAASPLTSHWGNLQGRELARRLDPFQCLLAAQDVAKTQRTGLELRSRLGRAGQRGRAALGWEAGRRG